MYGVSKDSFSTLLIVIIICVGVGLSLVVSTVISNFKISKREPEPCPESRPCPEPEVCEACEVCLDYARVVEACLAHEREVEQKLHDCRMGSKEIKRSGQ